jgi:hypothetical protein
MHETHRVMGDKVIVYRRKDSDKCWQCATFLSRRMWRKSTREDSLAKAKDFAEDWYLGLRGKQSAGLLEIPKPKPKGPTFQQAADKFMEEYVALVGHERSPKHIKILKLKLRLHLIPFFGNMAVTEITSDVVQQYRVHRATTNTDRDGNLRPPSRTTIHHEIVTLRHALKTALQQRWITGLPDLSERFKASNKVSYRPWFPPADYKALYEATRARTKKPPEPHQKADNEDLHDYVLIMANSGLRTDEADNLELRDIAVIFDKPTGEYILDIDVRGKRGQGTCKTMPGAVAPFERLRDRKTLKPTDRLFKGRRMKDLLNEVLVETNLKLDRDGKRRSAYSLRHTYICFRLLAGADVYQVAKNCRTSVEVIQTNYAAHIKNFINTAAVNVPLPKPDKRQSTRHKPKSGKQKAA